MKHAVLIVALLLTATGIQQAQTAEAWKKLGNQAFDSADYVKATAYYLKAVETDSNYYDGWFNLGNVYATTLDYDKSLEAFGRAVAKCDTLPEGWFALGFVYSEKADYDKAIEMYRKGISLKPDSPQEHYLLAMYCNRMGYYLPEEYYLRRAAQLGDSLARQIHTENTLSWENPFRAPDYDSIRQNIEMKSSNLYYPSLWTRYQRGDSTLTRAEKRHLYYGYVYRKGYSPYAPVVDSKKIYAILQQANPGRKDWEKLLSLLNSALEIQPFDCRFLYYRSLAYDALGKTTEAAQCMQQINCVIGALQSTGDGFSKETAIHVIAVPSEYDYLYLLNLNIKQQALIEGGYDLLSLLPNKHGIVELWFDVNQSFAFLNKNSK